MLKRNKYWCYLGVMWLGVVAFLTLAAFDIQPSAAQAPPAPSCNAYAVYDASTNGSTQLVTAKSIGATYVCGYQIWAGGTATVKLVYGTGTTCGTGTVGLTPAYALTAQTGIPDTSPFFRGLFVPEQNNICITTSAGVAIQALVFYLQR